MLCCAVLRCAPLCWHECVLVAQPQPVGDSSATPLPPSLLPSLPRPSSGLAVRPFPLLGFLSPWMFPSFPPHPENKCPPKSRVTLPSGFLPLSPVRPSNSSTPAPLAFIPFLPHSPPSPARLFSKHPTSPRPSHPTGSYFRKGHPEPSSPSNTHNSAFP